MGTEIRPPADERFAFGQNWQSFSGLVDEERLAGAESRLAALLGARTLGGQSFLDIGCGSGLHALAALRLGAERVVAIDIDPLSASTARELLERFWGKANASVITASVLDLESRALGEFDVVYSWGVLHHTGDMARAIRIAARHVRRGGLLALALYGKTPWCGLWTRIKRWYVNAPPERQAWAERLYVRLFGLYLLARGKRLRTHIEQYAREKRGMDFHHDVRDWIGGYPYESIAPGELKQMLGGFDLVREKSRRRSGLFGSGNDEYLFRKR
jgi:2-polyprenyl-6-hydroxyphenyl methylase/3-demethylubiquinone-9 3-methyltransferase